MSITTGTLEKMNIIAYSDEGFSSQVGSMNVQINPSSYHSLRKHNYTETPAIGGIQVYRFGNEEAQKQSFEFLFDASGVISGSEGATVKNEVKKLVQLIFQIKGSTHKPNNLLLSWGVLQFRCFCESIDIEYTHFNLNGIPIRAKVKAEFKQKVTHKEHQKSVQKNSPDMTHHKVISAAENIIGIAHKIYKDPSYYIELARFNNLDTFRGIAEGTQIMAPPLKTTNHE
jgi:hypothetical protein